MRFVFHPLRRLVTGVVRGEWGCQWSRGRTPSAPHVLFFELGRQLDRQLSGSCSPKVVTPSRCGHLPVPPWSSCAAAALRIYIVASDYSSPRLWGCLFISQSHTL